MNMTHDDEWSGFFRTRMNEISVSLAVRVVLPGHLGGTFWVDGFRLFSSVADWRLPGVPTKDLRFAFDYEPFGDRADADVEVDHWVAAARDGLVLI